MHNNVDTNSFETSVPVAIRLLTSAQSEKLAALGHNPAHTASIGSHVTLLIVIHDDEVKAAQVILSHSAAARARSDVHAIAEAVLAIQSTCGAENQIHFATTQNLPPHYQAAVDKTMSDIHHAIHELSLSYSSN